jgi:hypothetical protein
MIPASNEAVAVFISQDIAETRVLCKIWRVR